MQRERERESYNLENSFSFKYLFAYLKEKNNIYSSCSNNAENLLTSKLYVIYKKQKVDISKYGSRMLKCKIFNNTS